MKHQICVAGVLQYHMNTIITSIKRRLIEKESYKNPWEINVEINVHCSIFMPFYKAIRDFKTAHGRTIEVTRYRSKSAPLKEVKITFVHFGAFVFHISQATNKSKEEVKSAFKRKWKSGNVTQVVVNENKPVSFVYKVRSNQLKVKLCYSLTNKYGTVCSY